MLERVVAWFCNNYLGRYLENLNTDQLSVALLQGEVELENVPLKRDILDQLGLPLQIHAGFVGKICFKIPFSKIRSEPWVISFEQVYLVAGPKDKNEPYNEESEESAAFERKVTALDMMEAEWRSENDPQGLAASSSLYSLTYSSWLSYGASLVTNIVQNIQLKIKDIHIRYEDGISCPGKVFACGVRVDSATAQTCDENWVPKFMPCSNNDIMYKLLELDGLAVYWDTNTELFSDLPIDVLTVKLMQSCTVERNEFILAPVSGYAHLKRNCSSKPLRSLNQPRIACDFQLERVNVELRDVQYHQLVQCCRSLELLARGLQYRRWRVDSEGEFNACRQWKFAGQCIISDIRKRNQSRNWPFVINRAKEITLYVQSFKEHLLNPTSATAESKLFREKVESELELKELQMLRSIAMHQISRSQTRKDSLPDGNSSGSSSTLFQRWFSSWWSTEESSSGSPQSANDEWVEHDILETLEDAMRDNTIRQRDILPLQLSYTLKQGLVRLSTRHKTETGQSWSTLLELECDNVVQEWESRPRLKSHKFHLSLGNVWVRDCSTPGTLFPLIVSPQRKDARPFKSSVGMNYLIPSFNLPFFRSSPDNSAVQDDEPLFDLVYEKRPPGSDWNHRLKINSMAIECVYNHQLFQKIMELFSAPHKLVEERSLLGQRLRQAARSGFEAVKQKTKERLTQTLNAPTTTLPSQQQSWDLLINISAPHILIPESVVNRDSLLLIVDFGHFHVTRTNVNCIAAELISTSAKENDDDDDEEYITPCSTPPNESVVTTPQDDVLDGVINDNREPVEEMPDKYNVHFSDLQLLVCRIKDHWKQAHLKGTSALHLLDRFSILIHVEKYGRITPGLEKPLLSLSASLPHLVAHINEPKVHALVSISKKFRSSKSNPPVPTYEATSEDDETDEFDSASAGLKSEEQWFLAQFNIEQLSVEVQSRGRSVAELQVGGVQASYSMRPSNSFIHLAVHSLLLVDAMQTLGSDYELLIASHKHVSMDSMSGSLKESEPTSPISPSSPDPSSVKGQRATSPVSLAQALSSLQTDPSWRKDSGQSPMNTSFHGRWDPSTLKSEALILIDISISEPTWVDGKPLGRVQKIKVHFNSLDVIANQDTVVELASFFQRITPKKRATPSPDDSSSSTMPSTNQSRFPPFTPFVPNGSTEITFDFHRLTVLLLRSSVKDDMLVGRKVATLTVTEAHINANLSTDVLVQGSLGGLQVLDLTPEGHKHQRIVSVGHDPLVEQHQNLYMLVSQGLYETTKDKNEVKAFSFKFLKPELEACEEQENDQLSLEIRMASLCYSHSVHFLAEVNVCVSEFKQSVSNMAMSLKLTAAGMAVDLLHRGTEGVAQSFYTSGSPSVSEGLNLSTFKEVPEEEQVSLPSRIRFSALLESPILVLPRSAKSPQVLVAHLGQIEVSNDKEMEPISPSQLSEELSGGTHKERFEVVVRDMSLYSLNVDEKWKSSFSHFYSGPSAFLRITAQELYSCASPHGRPILHDTLLRFSLHRITDRPILSDADPFLFPLTDFYPKLEVCDVFQVQGCVVSPLQVSLSKAQYQQIIDSLDNLNWSKVDPANNLESGPDFPSSTKARPVPRINQRELVLNLYFQLPRFSMKLVDNSDRAIVSLSFEDFLVAYEQNCTYSATVQTSLKSLVLEDLMMKEDSKYRRLVASNDQQSERVAGRPNLSSFMSSSCPDLRNQGLYAPGARSLPARLELDEQQWKSNNRTKNRSSSNIKTPEKCPNTPPSSPSTMHHQRFTRSGVGDNNLVFIKILLVDPDSPDFALKYSSTHRFIEINFNALDVIINLESWVMVLDFFGPSRDKAVQQQQQKKRATVSSPGYQDWSKVANSGTVNSRWEVEVRSFNVLLNRKDYEVAEATISNLTWEMASMRGNLDITGKLGSITVQDLTSAGRLYRERFITSGNEALDFQFFCFSADDPHLARDYDVRLNLNMASVLYVHTQRFYTECFSLLEQFQRLQQVASSISANMEHSSSPMGYVSKKPWRHGTRILLNVEAGSPVILVPVCSTSEHLLVIDLGRISVSNRFVMSNGAVSVPTAEKSRKPGIKGLPELVSVSDPDSVLVDVIQVELSHMDLCTGHRQKANRSQVGDLILGSYLIRRSGQSLLKETCEMKLQVRRNLDSHLARPVPDMDLCGLLSTVECSIDEHQYKLVRGLLIFNLGESLDYLYSNQPNPTSTTVKLPHDAKPPVWPKLKLRIDLVNVILQVRDSRTGPFSTIKFIDSRLVYESNSDGSKDVDLVSQQVVIRDTRYDAVSLQPSNTKRNVFNQILEPVTNASQEGSLQAEVHYRSTEDFSRFTVVLNNMRLLTVFDWWTLFQDFLLQSPDEYQGLKTDRDTGNQAEYEENSLLKWSSTSSKPSPIVVSTGVISKRAALVETHRVPIEFKINIHDSEVVIIEDTSAKDSSAVILKGTALLTYRPQIHSKPFSCQLNRVEIFSSQLNLEEETALSIVDPATISIEIVGKSSASDVKGILDATSSELHQILEIQAQQLILRLSYNDMKLFLRIFDSVPRQARSTISQSPVVDQVEKLKALGFTAEDCQAALRSCNDNLEEAALWLTQNASATIAQEQSDVNQISIRGIEVRTGCISLCVIDDCRDADLPLIEVATSQVLLRQSLDALQMNGEGSITCQFAIEYYNRVLSGWEPFIEPFQCHVRWNFLPFITPVSSRQHPSIHFDTKDVVNVTCTRALLELFKTVKMNWMEDYYGPNVKEGTASQVNCSNAVRQRSPFVPFALYNATGSRLKFRTQTASLLADSAPSTASKSTRWIQCEAGDVVAFSFENRGKLRHHDSHQMQTHQLVIEMDGWLEFGPISVDRVGVYFRYAVAPSSPERRSNQSFERELDRVLVVVAVTLEGSARRLVTVRSALQVTNNLEETIELRLEPAAFSITPSKTVRVPPCTSYPIPMSYLMAQIFVRPMAEKLPHIFSFCKDPIEWYTQSQPNSNIRLCNPVTSNQDLAYRFAVHVHRENFPPDKIDGGETWVVQPAHTITLLSPLVVVNLLPYELLWELKSVGQSGIIKPGKSTSIHTVNASSGFQISFRTENFVHSSDIVIGAPPHNFSTRLRLYDSANRLLLLQVKVSSKAAGSVKLSISAPYWIVNKAGIPLIFRQEGVQQEAAGQFDEHEMARSLSPMLFSFTDREASPSLTARIGTGLHIGCKPHWCQHFPLQKGVRVRSFLVSPRDGRPDLVYLVGISIRSGRGRYRDTQIVTLAPCYQLYNQSSWMLEVSQAYFATTFTDPGAQSTYLNLVPGCHLPFHWPRLDKDQLLCVRLLDVDKCHWSGGFAIRNINSFHVNIRNGDCHSNFLRVEIFQQECTYCVVFSDATGFPPPLRVDNLAQVPVVFHQTDVPETYLQTTVRPNSSMPYVLDEPMKPARLTVIAPGGVSASYDMTTLKEGSQLTYENFIYVCLSVTFTENDPSFANGLDPNTQELVLDVPEGTRVVLNSKETGKRSQLWRMTGSGMLQHEGSSPPRDPSHPQVDPSRILVLDIAGPALQPSEFVHLMLRKPDPRRQLTQTWRFTEDGRLCCGHSNVFVQAKDGFYGVRQGNDVVLGPAQSVTYYRMPNGVPAEQAIHWQRLRPGSGCLSVKTVMDGPTRVLQVSDFFNKSSHRTDEDLTLPSPDSETIHAQDMKVEMDFKGGLGLSIVNHSPPEELAYCRLSNITLEIITGEGVLSVEARVQSIQIDNSLQDPHCPVVVYVTPGSNQIESRNSPALHLTAHRILTSQLNADIFKHLIVMFKNLTINIEEIQLFKLLAFAGFNQSDLELERVDESDYESQRSLNAATSIDAKRYYFGMFKLMLEQVRLSVYTSNKLPPELKAIKRKLGLTLIKFEDANIELHPFIRAHPFETAQLIIDSIIKHYKDELKSQAARILGSTDFLGNPLGFVNDVTEGVSGFLNEGNVGALVQNVTFGLSNSAAKVTGSLSDGLGRVTMDERHEELRQRLLKHQGQSSDHLVAGLKGLGFGILGGMTSIFTQTYEGISNEGFGGLFTGFGKGLVGTVTKPAVGVLDLATGAASAVRDSSRSSSKEIPKRIRPPRLVIGPGGILPRYSEKQGRGQELLFQLNNHMYQETFVAYEALGSLQESLHMLISSENIRVFSMNSPNKEVVLDIHLSLLQSSKAVIIKDYGTQGTAQYYVELNIEPDDPLCSRRPQVRCDSESLAKRVTQEINYAKSVYEENRHSLFASSNFSP